MSWADIEDAVQKAVAEASGLARERVYWSYQNFDEPASSASFVVITFGGGLVVGQDWMHSSTDLTRPQGQEILRQIHGTREVALQVEVFTPSTSGDSAARHVAELIRGKLRLDGIRVKLRRAKISPFDTSAISYVPEISGARFRGRAVMTVRCYAPLVDCYEYVGYVARVKGWFVPSGAISYSGTSGIAFDSRAASGASGYQYRP